MSQPNLNTDKLQNQSSESSVNNSLSSEKLPSPKNDAPWLDCMDGFKYSESSDSVKEPEDDVDNWRSEGRGCLFF